MRFCILAIVILTLLRADLLCQSRAELEEQRKKTLEEINYVDNLLKTTSREKTESLNSLKIINNKLILREKVIGGMKEEVDLLERRIDLNTDAIGMMERDMRDLRNDYSRSVVNAYISAKTNAGLVYILSAQDFNQGYKRLKYLQQAAKFRRNEAEIMAEIINEIDIAKKKLQKDLMKISDLKYREEQQKNLLENEQRSKQVMVRSLNSKEKQLQKDLEDKRKAAKKIEAEIARIIEEERRKSIKKEMAPEDKLLGDNFSDNKGALPWPVDQGIITGHFGVQKHPVLKYVEENNIGIEITSSGNTPVKSIFKGEVAMVFPIPGENMGIIIKHGRYFSVYQNIVDVRVRQGDKVNIKQEIGKVYCDAANGNKAIMKFMIFEEKEKLDPELWISKKK
jgi:septal ring factor EnvC (AmiA/AmiB activator)